MFNSTWSVWLGTSGTNFHDPANWSSGGVPDASSRVLVESANPMVISWPVTLLDLTVGGGAGQASVTDYAPLTVNEDIVILTNGTLALNQPTLVRNGLYVFSGGTLTHSSNGTATEINKLDVTVNGNVGIDVNGAIDVTGKGYASWWTTGGTCHGGRGAAVGTPIGGACYGSIVAPTNLGSGGGWYAGGGAIRLTVSGTLRHDGAMYANGPAGDYYMGSGGSIFLTAGALIGIGRMEANGGMLTGHTGGGGGRIALVVTNAGADFSGHSGLVQARSSKYWSGATASPNTGAGTVYRHRATDRRGYGTVSVDNDGLSSTGYTDVPPNPPNLTNEVNFVTFYVSNAAMLRLTNNYIIGDIFLQSANAQLDLGLKTLTVRSKEHSLGVGAVVNYGAIVWWPYFPQGTIYFAK